MHQLRRWARHVRGSLFLLRPARVRLVAGGSWLVVLAGIVALAACGEAPGEADSPEDVPAETAAVMGLNPWVRVAIMPEGNDAPDAPPVNSAAYLVLANPAAEADALVAVETTVCDTVELHTVTMDEGVMRMRPVDSVAIPAGGEAVLEPGGYHIMLIGIHQPLVEGDTVALRLRLRSGEALDVTAPVLRGRGKPDGGKPDGV